MLHYEIDTRGDYRVLHVGDSVLDQTNEGTLRECVRSLVEGGSTRVVLDLSELKTISSIGLGALVTVSKLLNSQQGVLKLACLQEQVHSMLVLTELDRILPIAKTLEEACDQ